MPKDEFDFDDPMELNGVALLSDTDTTETMTECFIEEFMRMGYNHKQLLALFRNPHYLAMNMVLQNRGEPFVRNKIAEIFARWGRPIPCSGSGSTKGEKTHTSSPVAAGDDDRSLVGSGAPEDRDNTATDPLGMPVPKLNL